MEDNECYQIRYYTKQRRDIREITGFDCAIWDMQGLCLVRTNENLTEYELQIQDSVMMKKSRMR